MRNEGVVHFQRLKEYCPKPCLHHSKGTLYYGACPGMMGVEALGSHTSHWSSVRSDEGERGLEARVPAVCKDEVPWRRVQWPRIQWAVLEDSRVMDWPRPAHVRINEAALMVTNCLQNNGRKQFPVPVAVTIRAAWWLDTDMAAVDCSSCFCESAVSCQPCKPTGHCPQVFWGLREVDDLKIG